MKFAVGVNVTEPELKETVPFDGLLTPVTVSESPSGSVSLAVRSKAGKVSGESSLVDLESVTAEGLRLKETVVVSDEVLSEGVASFWALWI